MVAVVRNVVCEWIMLNVHHVYICRVRETECSDYTDSELLPLTFFRLILCVSLLRF